MDHNRRKDFIQDIIIVEEPDFPKTNEQEGEMISESTEE